jgi:hypothetical protein
MKKQIGALGAIALGFVLGISGISSFAQEKQSLPEKQPRLERHTLPDPEGMEIQLAMQGPDLPMPPPAPGDFLFLSTEMSFGGKLVKGAPYSAQAVTESTQVLGDGNRIVNKSTAMVYRDSEGRTRREQTLRAIGTMASSGDAPQVIFISDPVAGTSYSLDSRTHVAHKMPPFNFKFEFKGPARDRIKEDGPAAGGRTFEIEIERDVERNMLTDRKAVEAGVAGVAMGWLDKRNPSAKTESLGRQNVGGVDADGTRSTVTIAAGEIGNERPIEIVSERWYSPELQTVVMTRHNDPRFGETTYRLTNIDRSEPVRSLFEVPADYTVKEGLLPRQGPIRMRKPAPPSDQL